MKTQQNPEAATGNEVGGKKITIRDLTVRRQFREEYPITMEDIAMAVGLLKDFHLNEHPKRPAPENAVHETVINHHQGYIAPLVRLARTVKKWELRKIRSGVYELRVIAVWEKTVVDFGEVPYYDAEIIFGGY